MGPAGLEAFHTYLGPCGPGMMGRKDLGVDWARGLREATSEHYVRHVCPWLVVRVAVGVTV